MTTAVLDAPPEISDLSTHSRIATQPVAPLDITDERVMEMIQNHEEQGISLLHDRYARLLKALIMKVVHNEAESDDLLQEVYLEIWNRADGYNQEKGKPLSWIVTLTRRRAIDRLRKRESYCRMEERFAQATNSGPEEVVMHVREDTEHSEMREHLQNAMSILPAAQREVIELAYFGGLSQRDIAAKTGIPLGTIKTRLELAMKKLTLALSGFEDLL
jgi:RNA polymerase sigma-70 factor (ECF subfamily)